jgi:hypothetical protein
MTLEDNKTLACRWLDLVSAHDVDGLIEMSTADWTMEGGPPGLPAGAEGIRTLFMSIGPVEQTWTSQHVLAEGDFVVVRALNRCVQEQFFGVPAAGKPQVFSATFIHRIARGKVAQTWRNADDLGRLLQLGARIVPG